MHRLRYNRNTWLRHDLPAGLSVFFVALPLCLGIALASGAPLYSGLLSGIVGGLVVSLISGSALSVSGPAAGLSTVVAASIVSLGNFQLFLLAVVIAGAFQILMGVIRLGVISHYFPSSVIKGMLAAIGIILISKQIPVAIGYDQPDFWASGFLNLFTSSNIAGGLANFNKHMTYGAILITLISLLVLFLFQLVAMKKFKFVPAPLLAVLLGGGLAILFNYIGHGFALSDKQFVNIPPNAFGEMKFPDLTAIFSNSQIWRDGILIGFLATLETLLCIEAVDKLDKHNRITPVNRELIAQGIGNMTCGLLGGIPITAVVVRGAANANAGAHSRISAFNHGLFLLLSVMLIPFLLNMIPYACLAAILIVTGYNLTRPKLYLSMWKLGLKQFLPFIVTIGIILATDLLIGVCIGLAFSAYYIIQNNFKIDYHLSKSFEMEIEHYRIRLNSVVTFLNKVNLRHALDKIPEYSVLTIDGSESTFIDHDILEIISEFAQKAHDRHIEVHLIGIKRVNVTSLHT